MSGILNQTGAVSGILGTTVGTPAGGVAGSEFFTARSGTTGWSVLSAAALCNFESVDSAENYDDGSNYTVGTSRFTAPTTGIYQFGAVIYTSNLDYSNSFEFRISGGRLDVNVGSENKSFYMNMDSQGDYTAVIQSILKLTATEYVTVHAHDTSDFNADNSWWWGCRLS